ncbi:MAG TPA: sulfite exporter TauE/SafE family protein [Actinomycetota bacterium]|nr:sulfite exporter TauE/SafE family protein [Actinomycetota bacterium]
MTGLEQVAVFFGGMAAGAVNTIVGAGSLITFPLLLAIGYPPVVANVSNTVGLIPGSVSGAFGYRRELQGQRARLLRLCVVAGLGGLTGGLILLAMPEAVFEGVVPFLIALACVLVLVQPALARRLEARSAGNGPARRDVGFGLLAGVYLSGIYGGYFGAAQGVLLLGLLGIGLNEHLQRVNAAKNVIAATVNTVPAVLFILVADVSWEVALLLGTGSVLGGQIGARVGRRLPVPALRAAVLGIGILAIVRIMAG